MGFLFAARLNFPPTRDTIALRIRIVTPKIPKIASLFPARRYTVNCCKLEQLGAKPFRITTPYPTADEIAKIFGITPKRQKEIAEMMDRIHAKQSKQRSKAAKRKRKSIVTKNTRSPRVS